MQNTCINIVLLSLFLITATATANNGQTVSSKVFKVLTEAQSYNNKDQHNRALKKLNSLAITKLTPYEQSQILNMKGFIYFEKNQLSNALTFLNNSIATDSLGKDTRLNTLQTIAQIHYLKEDYSKAILISDDFLALEPSKRPQIFIIKGQAHFQLQQYTSAITAIKKSIALKKETGKKVYENDLLILSACYQELRQYSQQIQTLNQLIRLYPKKTYLLALAGAYYEKGDKKKQLSIYEALYEQGQLNEPQQITNLSQLYIINHTPIKAATVLQKSFDNKTLKKNVRNLKLLAHAWYAARSPEKSIHPLKEAAKKTKDGKTYMRLGHLLSRLERWEEAIDALTQAKKKGGLPKKHNVDLLTGVACFHAGHHRKAKKAFKQAVHQQYYAGPAKSWLNLLDQRGKTQIN